MTTAAAASPSPFASTAPSPSGQLRLEAVDVGQGAAIVVHFPDAVLVVDAANRFSSSTVKLVQHLQADGVTAIDAFVISNPDADHAGGCDELFASFEVRAFYHQGYPKDTQTWQECLSAAAAEGAPIHTDADLDAGTLLSISSHATVRLLNVNAGGSEPNPGSLALRVDFGEFSFILPGDIECAQEDQIRSAFDVDVDVIQAAHHGSKYGTCDAWLSATSPEAAFIPVGPNSYGHPTPEALGRLAAHGVDVYRTDLQGTITFTSDGSTWSVATSGSAAPTTPPATATPSPSPSPTPTSTEGAGQIAITNLVYDPAGDDSGANLVNEYVEIRNDGTSPIALAGWTLQDEVGFIYTFPSAFSLDAGASVKVRTGSGTNTATDLYWGRGSAVWNNAGGDTAYLRHGATLIDSYTYNG